MVDLVMQHCSTEEARGFLTTQAVGVFFHTAPMCWYGESPLAFACVYGLKKLVRKMLDTKLCSLNDNAGGLVGFFPLHAVVSNGNRPMFDFLAYELPEELAADKSALTSIGHLISLNMENMTPLQLTAKCGLRYMQQHIMKKELTRVLWVWGPVTQYQINLSGIDSSGDGASDVMEVIARDDASEVTQELVLDDFMGGFLFALYRQKWLKFGWYIHICLTSLDAAICFVSGYLCIQIKAETEREEMREQIACMVLLGLISALFFREIILGYLFAMNHASSVPPAELRRRTWVWMTGFAASANLCACSLLATAVLIYLYLAGSRAGELTSVNGLLDGVLNGTLSSILGWRSTADDLIETLQPPADAYEGSLDAGSGAHARHRRSLDVSGSIQHATYTGETELQRVEAMHDYFVMSAEDAAWLGMDPMLWMLLGMGFILKIYAFIDQAVRPFTQLSILVISVRQVLRGELVLFMTLFMIFISTFIVTMLTVYPDHRAQGSLPQAPSFIHPFSATHAIMMAGFTGEPLELNMHPDFLNPLGLWQKVGMVVFFTVYVLYIFLSLILLLNLLIALLGSTFKKTQDQATLQGRMSFARIVLRLELAAEMFNIDTHAGEADGDNHVHKFRSIVRDPDGELPRYYPDENVFDPPPAKVDGSMGAEGSLIGAVDEQRFAELKALIRAELRKESTRGSGGGGGGGGSGSNGLESPLASTSGKQTGALPSQGAEEHSMAQRLAQERLARAQAKGAEGRRANTSPGPSPPKAFSPFATSSPSQVKLPSPVKLPAPPPQVRPPARPNSPPQYKSPSRPNSARVQTRPNTRPF